MDESRKILIFSTAYFPHVGGAEIAVKEITSRLGHIEFDMVTVRFSPDDLQSEILGNVAVHRVGFKSLGKFNKTLFPILGFLKARRLHKLRKYEMTWAVMASYNGFAALFFKWIHRKIPFLLTLQEGDSPEHIRERVKWFYPLYKSIFKNADSIQAISHFLVGFGAQLGGSNIEVVPNGVDISKYNEEPSRDELWSITQSLGKKPGETLLITTSRLVRKNGVDTLIEALVLLPETVKLAILGTGEEYASLLKIVEERKLGTRVLFVGFVPHRQIPIYLRASDIFVRPSRSEGLGNSFIEAMAVGVPVVGTPVGGIPDFLKDGETGILCEPDNPKSVADAVRRIMSNPELRTVVSTNGKNLVVSEYDWNSVAQKMDAIFDKLQEER